MKLNKFKILLNQLHYLFNKSHYFFRRFKKHNSEQLHKEFVVACYEGKIEEVEYLLINDKLTSKINIHYRNDEGFRWACQQGNFHVVRFLLINDKLKEHANINANNEEGVLWCCLNGHLDILKYLLTSPELQRHGNIREPFDSLQIAFNNGHWHILNYLFKEFNLEKTKELLQFFEENPKIKQFKESLELHDKLNFELKINGENDFTKI